MQFHVSTGDSLADNFPTSINGEIIVSRECLIEGSLSGTNLSEFWQTRAGFIKSAYGEHENSYVQKVQREYEKLLAVSPEDTVNLWFEYDLFCQVNLWFTVSLLAQSNATNVYRVAPIVRNQNDLWRGFGNLNSKDLEKCFAGKIKFEKADVDLGVSLWRAYQNNDLTELERLSKNESACFPHLEEICAAEIARKTERRAERTLEEIAAMGVTDFSEMFHQFSQKEGVYGFGDSQVKRILKTITDC